MNQKAATNLNDLYLDNSEGPCVPLGKFDHRRRPVNDGKTSVYFDNLAGELIREIQHWDAVIGCVAWLTNEEVLKALATRQAVSFVIQKEDWLRPDTGNYSHRKLLGLYRALPASNDRYMWGIGRYSYSTSPEFEAVRCAGQANIERLPAAPRMHHKFMVFGNLAVQPDTAPKQLGHRVFQPQAVWTGSFNVTHNGTNSLENAILMRSPLVARAYHSEWKAIVGISEPLNWRSRWVAPEYRIGS